MKCPYCESTDILHSDSLVLHGIRILTGSDKHYCRSCRQKWRVRAHKRTGGSRNNRSTLVLLLIGMGVAFAFFRATDRTFTPVRQQSQSQSMGPLAAQMMAANGGKAPEGLPAGMDKNAALKKLEQFEKNPSALAKLDPQKRKMVEQALKMKKLQKQ